MRSTSIPTSTVEARLRYVEGRLAELEKLTIERDVLRRLLNDAVDQDPVEGETPTNGRLGPTEAVLELLGRSPGLTKAAIVDQLENRVRSNAADVRRTVYMTVGNLCRTGRLHETGGRYTVVRQRE